MSIRETRIESIELSRLPPAKSIFFSLSFILFISKMKRNCCEIHLRLKLNQIDGTWVDRFAMASWRTRASVREGKGRGVDCRIKGEEKNAVMTSSHYNYKSFSFFLSLCLSICPFCHFAILPFWWNASRADSSALETGNAIFRFSFRSIPSHFHCVRFCRNLSQKLSSIGKLNQRRSFDSTPCTLCRLRLSST